MLGRLCGLVWVYCALLGAAGGASAQAGDGVYLDDGYTWFSLTSHRAVRGGQPVSDGWSLLSNLRAWGPIPNRSAFKVVVEPPGGKVGVYQFQGQVYPDANGKNACLVIVGLRNTDVVIPAVGLVPVKVYLINGDTDEETLLRTYTLDVRRVARFSGSGSNPSPDAPVYYLARGGEVLASIIHRRWPRDPSYVWDNSQRYDHNVVEVLFTHAPELFDNPAHMSHAVVTVDGQPLRLAHDEVVGGFTSDRQERAEATSVPASKTGPLDRTAFASRQYYVVLPLTWGKDGDRGRRADWTAIDDHPGAWEVTWVQGTNVLRTWRFRVQPDGHIAQHPEEAAGLQLAPANFCPDATLCETVIPGGGSILDARLSPDEAKRGAFYGRAWTTPDMQASAARVPDRNTAAGVGGPAATVTTAAGPAGAAPTPTAAPRLDAAGLWLEVKTHEDTRDGKPYAKGWSLHGSARVLGDVGPRDTFRVRLTVPGKELGGFLASAERSQRGLAVTFPPINPTLFTATGPVEVELYHRSAAGAESQVAVQHIVVGKVTRVRGSRNTPQADAEHYYLDHHADALSSALLKIDGRDPAYDFAPNTSRDNALNIVWHLSPTDAGWHLANEGYCRISVDGQRLTLTDDKVRTGVEANAVVTHSSWAKPDPRGGAGSYFEELRFCRLSSRLPVTWGAEKAPGYVVLEDHPGRWEVQYLHQQRPVRTWRFTVNADGSIAPHPEQATLAMAADGMFVETEIPAGGSFADARLVPAAAQRGRFGGPWVSAEGKSLAARVPSKGQAAP